MANTRHESLRADMDIEYLTRAPWSLHLRSRMQLTFLLYLTKTVLYGKFCPVEEQEATGFRGIVDVAEDTKVKGYRAGYHGGADPGRPYILSLNRH